MTIEELRARIDSLDEQLVTLLNQRAACAIEIGRIKRQTHLPVHQPEREAEVARHVREVSARLGGPLSGEAVGRLFERILDEDRRLEASGEGDVGAGGSGTGPGSHRPEIQ